MTRRDDPGQKAFAEAVRRLPPPIADFADGAACPWCGWLHRTITYGRNTCHDCGRGFLFGHPNWAVNKESVSWVEFPWKEFQAMGERPELIEQWQPNTQIKALHFQKAEEHLGVHAEDGPKQ